MIQYAQKDNDFPIIHHIVILAPPNWGAEIADFFTKRHGMKKLLVPNLEQMRTDSNSYTHRHPVTKGSELGFIIGVVGKSK